MLQLTWKFVHVDIELKSNRLEFKHLEIESIGLDLVLLKQLSNCLVLPFLFFTFSKCRPTLLFQAPKTHEQIKSKTNQTHSPL